MVDPRTIVVVPETPDKRGEYDELVIRTFYVSHGNVETLAELLSTLMSAPNTPNAPQLVANLEANAITVRATAPVVGIVERVLAANDKPRAEGVIVEILEVNRERAKRYGLDLSRYSISTTYSPGGVPAGNGDDGASAASGLSARAASPASAAPTSTSRCRPRSSTSLSRTPTPGSWRSPRFGGRRGPFRGRAARPVPIRCYR